MTAWRAALRARGVAYCVAVEPKAKAWTQAPVGSPPSAVGRPLPKDLLPNPKRLEAIARELPARAWRPLCWREGTRGPTQGRFARVAIWASHGYIQRQHGGERTREWLLIEWPKDQAAPIDYWLAHLGGAEKTPILQALVGLGRERWRIELDYRELKDELGLDHFEGRSYPGWHHHVTLVCLAHLFLQSQRAPRPTTGAGALKNQDQTPARASLPQTRRLHAALVRMCCARCPWCASRLDSSWQPNEVVPMPPSPATAGRKTSRKQPAQPAVRGSALLG